MNLANLLTRAMMLSAPLETTALGQLRARVFGQLRASGWAPTGEERGGPPHDAKSDNALLRAFLEGNAAAFDGLFNRHAPRLRGLARRWLRAADADDIVQEAFVVLLDEGASILEHDAPNVGAYLFAVARKKTLRALAARETPTEDPDAPDEIQDDPLTAALRREDTEHLAKLLDQECSPLEQDVVILTLEDNKGPEIAAALEISKGNVRVVRHRAYAKLRRALGEEAS
ncbi:MAG: sigma-70 family RNA polymerase sigma factor [Polyangiaceae bacterium]